MKKYEKNNYETKRRRTEEDIEKAREVDLKDLKHP